MDTEPGEAHGEDSRMAFQLEVLRLLASTCEKHIEALAGGSGDGPRPSDPDHATEADDLDKLTVLVSSLLYDFSRNLQSEASFLDTFDLVQKSCDSIKRKLEAITYAKWNRLCNRSFKNVYYKLLKRSRNPAYRRTPGEANEDFKMIFTRFDRTVNIWGHHVLYDDFNAEKSYNEPPQVQVIKFDVTGDVIITGGSEGIIKLWDVFTCKTIMSLKKHSGAISNMDIHANNAFIVSSCEGGEIWLWEVSHNFYRPHRMLKSTYKFLWVRFLVNDYKSELGRHRMSAPGRMDGHDRLVWERSLDETLLVSLDANSVLRVYKMRDLLSSSAGDNIYTEVTPLYHVDLFNHNITAYDLSRSSFNGTFLTAIGIEPLDKQDFDNADLDDINTALNYIKNDTFHKRNMNIKGRYRDLIGKSGFALLMIPLKDPAISASRGEAEGSGDSAPQEAGRESVDFCCCDAGPRAAVTCINTCVFCARPRFVENRRLTLSISHYEGSEAPEPAAAPKSMFLWNSPNSSEIEKFFVETIPEFTFFNHLRSDSLTPNMPTMHYGKLTSCLILPSCPDLGLGSERESPHFDKLFLNFVKDAHILSPDVCFANTSSDHISASDDGKIFLWLYESEGFKSIQLTTKTMERWRSVLSLKSDQARADSRSSASAAEGAVSDRTFKVSQKQRCAASEAFKSPVAAGRVAPGTDNRDSSSSIANNTLYVVVSLSWSSHDKYVCVADSLVSRYNYKKVIMQARTNFSGLSFFKSDGARLSDFLHDSLTFHVSCVAFNPVCEEVCAAATYDGLIVILDVVAGAVLRRMHFGPTSIWLDLQWHPMGHKFVACQKYGAFSLFSSDPKALFEKTPNFQSSYLDYYCNSLSFANSAYAGPESNNVSLRKYYSSFSNAPITLAGHSTYGKVTRSLHGGPVVFLDERKNSVVVHTSGLVRRCPVVSYFRAPEEASYSGETAGFATPELVNVLYRSMRKVPGFAEYFEAHYKEDQSGEALKIMRQFMRITFLVFGSGSEPIDPGSEAHHPYKLVQDDAAEFKCYLGECPVCENMLTLKEQAQKYQSLNDSFAQLKSLTDKNGVILRSVPPSARPQDLAETLGPEPMMTPPRRGELGALLNVPVRSSRIVSSPQQTENLAPAPLFQDSIMLENNVLFSSNTESGSNLPSESRDRLGECSSSDQGPEATLDPEEDDDADFELAADEEEDEEEEAEEEDNDYDDEDDTPVQPPARRSARILRSQSATAERATRSSAKRPAPDSKRERESNQDPEKEEKYSFRSKRGKADFSKERQLESARALSLSVGPIAVKFHAGPGDFYSGKVCVFCGMGESGDYSKLTRTQTQRFSNTLFLRGNSFNPGCSLFHNAIVGPMEIPRRLFADFEDYFELFRRLEASAEIFAHASCLATSSVKIDAAHRLLNLPEVLVQSSLEVCAFCDSKFATVPCARCGAFFHYPCTVAQYKSDRASVAGVEVLNIFDLLVSREFVCLECALRQEADYLESACFLSPDSRTWLMNDTDSYENPFNVQLGDCLVLTQEAVVGRVNVHLPWLAQREFPMLVKVVDMVFVFTGSSQVVPCLQVESVFGEFDRLCIFARPEVRLVLLRDFVASVDNMTGITAGSSIKCKIQGEIVEAKVKTLKARPSEEQEPPGRRERFDLDILKRLLASLYSLGREAISVQMDGVTKWVNAWDVCFDVPQANDIKLDSFLEYDRQALIEIFGDDRFEPFYMIEEYKLGTQHWLESYWRSIARPIWTKEITDRLFNQFYRTPLAMYGDIKLMIANCNSFNAPLTQYSKLARELDRRLAEVRMSLQSPEEWSVILAHLWSAVGGLVELPKGAQKPRPKPAVSYQYYDDDGLSDSGSEEGAGSRKSSKKRHMRPEQPLRRSSRHKAPREEPEEPRIQRKRSRYNLR